MSNSILDKIKRGIGDTTHRLVFAGPEGIGKTTFASKAPNPLFVSAEDGLTGFDHIQRFIPRDLSELHSFLDSLIADPMGFKTLVVDTSDWFERFLGSAMCARDGKSDIEDYGYGKGYVLLENELVNVLGKFDILRSRHKMWIIILSHVKIKAFNDPRGDSWDRYEMKGHQRFTGILREWPDACLFGVYEVFKTKEKGSRVEKAVGGERILHTEWSPAWDAKNRLNLPEHLPMEWDDLERAIRENSNTALVEKIKKLHSTAKFSNDPEKAAWDKAVSKLNTMTADKLKSAIAKLTDLQPK